MSLQSLLESTCSLFRPTTGRDTDEGTTQDPFTVVIGKKCHKIIMRDIPCSVQESGASIVGLHGQRRAEVSASIYFDEDIGARPDDRLEVVDEDGGTRIFLVQGPAKAIRRRAMSPWTISAQEIL